MLSFTGHPIYDVGVATVTAFCKKNDPSEVTEEDLSLVADFIETQYPQEPFKSYLTVAFTSNAWFAQPSFRNAPEKRQEYARRITRSFSESSEESDEMCVFTGEPITSVAFSDKLPSGRGFRQHIPLVSGEGIMNFFPEGNPGMPVSGKAALCIHAFPLGCGKCGGKLLAVHSDSPDIIMEFARTFLEQNLRAADLARAAGSSKLPEANMSAKTLLIDILLKSEAMKGDVGSEEMNPTITAYHLSNAGQMDPLDRRNPPLEIYHLPLEISSFLRAVSRPRYNAMFSELVRRAWQIESKDDEKSGARKDRPKRNYLYEDLFTLPGNAPQFIRRYFLRIPVRRAPDDDPRKYYSIDSEANLVSWDLVNLFLEKVMLVDKERIEEIRKLGDSLAEYVARENDRRFFTAFYSEMRYGNFRNALIKANLRHVRNGNPPLITLDPYITIFEEGYDIPQADWRLSRDLVLIRMVEQLYKNGWLGANKDVIAEPEEEIAEIIEEE